QPDVVQVALAESALRFDHAGDHFGAFVTWSMSAEVQREDEHYDDAIEYYEKAIASIRAAQSEPLSLEALTVLAPVLHYPVEAVGQIAAMPELLKPILLPFMEVMARDGYAAALLEIDQLDRAEAELDRATDTASRFPGLFDVTLAMHPGSLPLQEWSVAHPREPYVAALAMANDAAPIFGTRNQSRQILA